MDKIKLSNGKNYLNYQVYLNLFVIVIRSNNLGLLIIKWCGLLKKMSLLWKIISTLNKLVDYIHR